MKQIVWIGLIILWNCSLFGQSQPEINIPQNDRKNTVAFSYSPVSLTSAIISFNNGLGSIFSSNNFGVVWGDYGVRGVVYSPRMTAGLFSIAYERSIGNRLSWRIGFAYEQFRSDWDLYVNEFSPHYFTERTHIFQLIPEIRFDYLRRQSVRFFMSGGLGLIYFQNSVGDFGDIIGRNRGVGVGFQIWLFGIEVEPVENFVLRVNTIGLGTLGLLELGVGYRF